MIQANLPLPKTPGIITSFGGEGLTCKKKNEPSGRRNKPEGRKSEPSGRQSEPAGKDLNFATRNTIFFKIPRIWTNWLQKLGQLLLEGQ